MAIPSVLISGQEDGKRETLDNDIQGGLKRVGGQGDILSGSTGVLLAWGSEWVHGTYAYVCASTGVIITDESREIGHPAPDDKDLAKNVPLLAAYGASTFNRTVSKRGFEKKGRSMVTGDLVDLVGPVYSELFESDKGKL